MNPPAPPLGFLGLPGSSTVWWRVHPNDAMSAFYPWANKVLGLGGYREFFSYQAFVAFKNVSSMYHYKTPTPLHGFQSLG